MGYLFCNPQYIDVKTITNMKKLFKSALLLIGLVFASTQSFAQVNSSNHYVSGHYRSNGTYVQGYYRTNANSTINDNYSTYPNVNPYTGSVGTVRPTTTYTTPTISTPMYRSTTPTYSTPTYSTPSYYTTPIISTPIISNPYRSLYSY